jgi:hypothetical protein
MNFKLWLESEYTRDTFNPDMDDNHPDIADRRKAADTFIMGDYLEPHEKENIKLINLPKTKRIVVSAYREPPIPLPLKNLDVQENRYHGIKPIGGLWYAFGNDWIRFAQNNLPNKMFMFIHEIYVNTSNMIVLNSEKEKRDFEIKYGWTGESDRQSGTGGNITKYKGAKDPRSLWINWKDVEKDYGGVEIHRDALNRKYWNDGWDMPSGCIWNKNALKDSKLLYVYNVKTKTYVKPNELGIYAGKSSKIKNPLLPTNTQPPTN